MQDILKPLSGHLPSGMQAELRAQRNTNRRVMLLSGNLVGNVRTESSGVCARLCKGGVYGFASEAEFSSEAAKRVLKTAEHNALFMDEHAGKGKPARPAIAHRVIDNRIDWKDAEQKLFIEYLRELDDYVAKKEKLIGRRIVCFTESMEKSLLCADGADAFSTMPRAYIYVVLNAESKDGGPVEVFKALGGFGGFDEQFSDPALLYPAVDRIYDNLMKKTEAVYAEAGLRTVIIGGGLGGMLAHEAVGHTVEADLVIGGSVAGKCRGKQVASEIVNLTDFASSAFGKPCPLPIFADDEGVPAVDAPIIKDGILVGYMHNRESAERFGDRPCGNARAYAYSDEPLIRMRNTAIHPGKDKLEDMIASVDDGYYLTDTSNGQADNTGEFMFGVTMGYEIKNGKLGKAIFDTTISGVAFEMLKTVDMLSSEMTWESSGYCGKKQMIPVGLGGPDMRCKITMGGR
ncbi:MAG TPA: TldD/PmbA family protein [Bacillota bacterium]|nr:TldD/PmbA family protein [Bacillota bacterium]